MWLIVVGLVSGPKALIALPQDPITLIAGRQTRSTPSNLPHAEDSRAAVPTRLEFAIASIKPMPLSYGPYGLACRGIDGSRYARWGNFASSSDLSSYPIKAPQGRCVGNGVSLAALVEFAYDRYVSGGPDWVQAGIRGTNVFQVEAAAENPSTATVEQLRQMLQTMLADRFNLKVHRETQDVAGYALLVARNGQRLKDSSIDEKMSPFSFVNSEGKRAVKGKSGLAELAQFLQLSGVIGPGNTAFVVNKTGLTGTYDYEFVLPPAGGGGQRGPGTGQTGGPPAVAERVPAISAALENQLGLRLQAEKVPSEAIVIDQAEKSSPN
jgi:uncharacterized protein (TIGR03435 family)